MDYAKIEKEIKEKISEDKYDEIMSDSAFIYDMRKSVDDPYAFHKAFECAMNKLSELTENDGDDEVNYLRVTNHVTALKDEE